MGVTALCIRLLICVLLLLPVEIGHCSSHKAESTIPRVVPSRLQLFEYEPLSVNCEGLVHDLIKWRVMRIILGSKTICNNKWEITGSCNITTAFTVDSGEYWCEAEGKKTSSVSITVTAGDVVLESPALPVMEGEDVTLRCRKRRASTTQAEFYKDDLLIGSSSTGQMTIHNISKSDEGLYRCRISGVGGSARSRLAVEANKEETPRPFSLSSHVFMLFLMVLILLILALLVLLVLGLYYIRHTDVSTSPPSCPTPSPLQSGPGASSASLTHVPAGNISPSLPENICVYYTISDAKLTVKE